MDADNEGLQNMFVSSNYAILNITILFFQGSTGMFMVLSIRIITPILVSCKSRKWVINQLTSSSRASRGRKFQKKKEL